MRARARVCVRACVYVCVCVFATLSLPLEKVTPTERGMSATVQCGSVTVFRYRFSTR